MRRFASKIAFPHRTLWQRDQLYRWAVLLGPPPVVGVAVAALVLAALHGIGSTATVAGRRCGLGALCPANAEEGEPFADPTQPLPPTDASGRYRGFQPGWRGEIRPVSMDATKSTNVAGSVLATFALDQADIPLQRIVDAGPPTGLFVGVAQSLFVARAPGIYEFSVRLVRSGTQSADCEVRLGSARRRMVSEVTINVGGSATLTYPATQFRLDPGLFLVVAVVGYWRGDRVLGAGDVTLLVRPPGEPALRPAAADELMRAVAPDPARANAVGTRSPL